MKRNFKLFENVLKSPSKTKSGIQKLFKLAKPEMKYIVTGLCTLGISTGISLFVPYEIGQLVDVFNFEINQAKEGMIKISKELIILFGIGTVTNFVRLYSIYLASQNISTKVRKDLFKNLMKQEVEFFDQNKTGEIINRLGTDIQIVSETLTITIINGFRSIVEAFGGIIILLYLSPKLTIYSILILPPIAILSFFIGKKIRVLHKDYLKILAESNTIAEEKISNIKTVRLFSGENYEIKKYNESIDNTFELGKKVAFLRSIFFSTVFSITNISLISIVYIGGLSIIDQSISIGTLTSFLIYSVYVGISFSGLSQVYSDLMKSIGSSERIFELLEKKTKLDLNQGLILNNVQGKIEFKNVSFKYPNRNEIEILKNISFKIEPGQVIAIVGLSGSGKSTITSLLTHLYSIDSGNILIDDHNIKDLNSKWLREIIGIVSQEPTLFNTSIENNISYPNENKDINEIENVSKQSYSYQFINQFPLKFNENVGERGQQLSGGQKQRIALARALYKDPKILILDEASSALDSESEYLINNALKEQFKKRTIIIIAHRLSTIKYADNILVIDKGEIIEQGNHDDLILKNGLYFKIFNKQF